MPDEVKDQVAAGVQSGDKLPIEIYLLASAAVRRLAGDVALALRSRLGQERMRVPPAVVLASEEMLAAIPRALAVSASLDLLLARSAGVGVENSAEAAASDEPKATADTGPLQPVEALVQGLTKILEFFKVDTTYINFSVKFDVAGLRSALAGALVGQGFEVIMPEYVLRSATDPARQVLTERLARLQMLRAKLATDATTQAGNGTSTPGTNDHRSNEALATEIDAFIGRLGARNDPSQPSLLEQALQGAEAAALFASSRPPFCLTARVLVAGGNSRSRTNLFLNLLLGEDITIAAGAAVAFAAVDASTGSVVLADVLQHLTGRVRFPSKTLDWGRGASDEVSWNGSPWQPAPKLSWDRPQLDRDISPNAGDDEAADPGDRSWPADAANLDTAVDWRVAESLLRLREQVNSMAPLRSKSSDGTIGDERHRSRSSDHNPWISDGAKGVVTALDVTHDPGAGCDAGRLADAIVGSRDPRVKYVIWNRRISNSRSIDGAGPWAWRAYDGANPHDKHVHVSVLQEKAAFDDRSAWQL